jgi:hypothetical protein
MGLLTKKITTLLIIMAIHTCTYIKVKARDLYFLISRKDLFFFNVVQLHSNMR